MKINLNSEDLKHLQNIIINKDQNINLSALINDYVINYDSVLPKKEIEAELKNGKSLDEIIKVELAKDLNLSDFNKEDREIICNQVINHVQKMNYGKYINNEYYKTIKIDHVKEKNWELSIRKYQPYEIFISDDLRYEKDYKEILSLGYFDKEFPYVAAIENGVLWMSIIPSEIDTMILDINNAKGNVITFGLGLGYYAFMVSNKDDVTSMTIVERDPKVIELFTKYILPQFPHKEKIRIISEDAYTLLNDAEKMGEYDYIYIDIWHGAEDGTYHYVKMKSIEKKNNMTFYYWLEPSILGYLRRCVITLFQENLEGYTKEDYLDNSNKEYELINKLYFATENEVINSFDDVTKLLSDEYIKNIIC